uniref:Uncharacterized protein n=1 Tax=Arundo donax TaxID=35708 RepID=A0A0A9QWG1_ARUDO
MPMSYIAETKVSLSYNLKCYWIFITSKVLLDFLVDSVEFNPNTPLQYPNKLLNHVSPALSAQKTTDVSPTTNQKNKNFWVCAEFWV